VLILRKSPSGWRRDWEEDIFRRVAMLDWIEETLREFVPFFVGEDTAETSKTLRLGEELQHNS